MLHNSLREIQTTIKWPATPQEIAETNDDIFQFNIMDCSSERSNNQ